MSLQFGVDLARCNPHLWLDVARHADELGFESVWLPEHLVFPAAIDESPAPGRAHGRVDPMMPVFDAFSMLGAIAAVTRRVRLGTNVFNIGLRHPFITARGSATVDVISNGRFALGVGASWLAGEWEAVGLDFASRGSRVDEAIALCRRLWTEPTVEHRGGHFSFGPVAFEPKPPQGRIPIHVGGDSPRALRRVAEYGDGWIGMLHDPTSFEACIDRLAAECDKAGRSIDDVERTALAGHPSASDVALWRSAGASRLIVAPWRRSRDALDGLEQFASGVARHG